MKLLYIKLDLIRNGYTILLLLLLYLYNNNNDSNSNNNNIIKQ